MDLVWSLQARQERRSQLAYIASKNPTAALEAGFRLRDSIENLAVFPNAGRSGRRPGTRELVIANTPLIAVYRVEERLGEGQILSILHVRQKYPPE